MLPVRDPRTKSIASYLLLYPLVWLYAKSPNMATQTVLHALFLPTPFKRALAHLAAATDSEKPELSVAADKGGFTEVVKPGALYRECSVVTLKIAPLPDATPAEGSKDQSNSKSSKKGKEKSGTAKSSGQKKPSEEVDIEIEDDEEYGGEGVGRVVWEWYETRLKDWEAKTKPTKDKEDVVSKPSS